MKISNNLFFVRRLVNPSNKSLRILLNIKSCLQLEIGVRSVKLPVCKSQNVRTNKTFVYRETTCKKDRLQQKTNFDGKQNCKMFIQQNRII